MVGPQSALGTFLDLQVSLVVEDQIKLDPVNCANVASFFFTYIFLFLNEAFRVPNFLGLPPTQRKLTVHKH